MARSIAKWYIFASTLALAVARAVYHSCSATAMSPRDAASPYPCFCISLSPKRAKRSTQTRLLQVTHGSLLSHRGQYGRIPQCPKGGHDIRVATSRNSRKILGGVWDLRNTASADEELHDRTRQRSAA